MKRSKRIITFFLSLAIVFTLCLPALATPAEAVAPAAVFDQVGSDASITLNNGDVLRVPAEAITGNYIVYRVNNGVYRYYVIDVFENTDGVKEMAFLSFTRYVGQHAITNANALSPNVWTIYGMQNVLYAISGALTVRPMYSTFDYYDALGFLLIGGYGSETTEDDFSGTFEVDTPENDFTLPREIMGEHFMVINDPDSKTLDTIQVVTFPNYENGNVYEGAFADYNMWSISEISVVVSFLGYRLELPNDFDHTRYPYVYVVEYSKNTSTSNVCSVIVSEVPYVSTSEYFLSKPNGNFALWNTYYDSSWHTWNSLSRTVKHNFASTSSTLVWSNVEVFDSSTGAVTWSPSSNCPSQIEREWLSTEHLDTGCTFYTDGWDILYSTFDYYDANGNLLYGNSFAGEVTEDDSLIDLTLDDGTVIRVPERFGERDSYYVVMDPVGGTEETAYLIYEFDYYEGVADGTVCDFTRWYGVATTTDEVTSWEWNYQDYYVTELDILDYGPIVYSTFEYVDGRTEEDDSGDGSTSEESSGFFAWFKEQWTELMTKLDEILTAIKEITGIETDPNPDCEHTYTPKIQREATCAEPGHMQYTCGGCGHSYTELIDPIGHDWIVQEHVDNVLDEEGNVTERGYDRVVCSVCKLETKDYGDGPVENDLFDAIGDLLAGAVDWILDKLAQLTDSLTGITDSFNSYLEQIKGLSGNYGLFFGEFLALLPKDFMSVVWFGVIAGIVGLVWKAWM